MKQSFDYNRYSPVHRHQSQRRVLKKLVFLLGLLGWMLLLIQMVFVVMWAIADDLDKIGHFKLATVYFGVAIGVFALRAILHRILIARSSRRRSRRAALARTPDRGGAVLVMVLVIVALLAGLILHVQVSAKLSHRGRGAELTETRLRLAATDAARAAMQTLADDPDLRTDHLEEAWAQEQDAVDPSGITTRVRITDLNRYFDLNNLSIPARPSVRPATDVLVDLLTLSGMYAAEARTGALQDWLDDNDEGFREVGYYRERPQPCRPPNRALYAWNELIWADGFAREDFADDAQAALDASGQQPLSDCLTLVPAPRESWMPINLNTAAPQTLHGVVGIENDDLMRRIVSRRDLRPLQQADATALAVDPNLAQQLAPYVAVRSTHFRIRSVAFLAGRSESVEAVVHRDGKGNVEVLQWAI